MAQLFRLTIRRRKYLQTATDLGIRDYQLKLRGRLLNYLTIIAYLSLDSKENISMYEKQ